MGKKRMGIFERARKEATHIHVEYKMKEAFQNESKSVEQRDINAL